MSADYLDGDKYLADYLDIAKQKFEEGNKPVLLTAMHQCLILKKPPPEWLRLAFIDAYQSATAFEIRSWNEVFGPPHPKKARLDTRKQHADLRYPIAVRVALRASGENIDKGLFETIGSEFGISGSTASDIYYKGGGKELGESIEPILPWLKSRLIQNQNQNPNLASPEIQNSNSELK